MQLIDDKNRKELFMKMVEQMDMSYSYKPVLLKAILKYADKEGRVKLEDKVSYFKNFYESRRASGLVVENTIAFLLRVVIPIKKLSAIF